MSHVDCCMSTFSYVAGTYVSYKLICMLYRVIYPFFLSSPMDLQKMAGAKWAVVTGATDGIGKEYAFALASKGFNILLVSRTQSKLDETKKEIEEKHTNIEVQTYVFDFCKRSDEEYAPLIAHLQGMEIGVLVNNVGVAFDYPEKFHLLEGGVSQLANVNVVNTLSVTFLCAAVLPQMSARKSGVIVNISSGAAYNLLTYWSIYSASKRFVQHLSTILQREYAPDGITIQTVSPMLVATKLSKIKRASFFGPDAKTFVQSAIRTVGLIPETTGFFSHQVQVEILNVLPEWLKLMVLEKYSLATRAAALRKRAKQQ